MTGWRGLAAGTVALAMLPGCPRPLVPAAPPLLQDADWTPPVLSGHVTEGWFLDDRFGLSVPIPEGWRAEPAAITDATRVVLVDPDGKVRMRIALGSAGPEPRGDCTWEFQDLALYTFGALQVQPSTCVPEDAAAPRILAWYAPGASPTVHVEAEAPPGCLLEAEDAAAAVLSGLR